MIGDVLTSSIVFELLKERYPKAELHYIINSHTKPVVENHPFIDKFVLFTSEIEHSKKKFYAFLKEIKTENYDATIDVYGKLSSKLISKFSRAPIRIAYEKKANSFFYSHSIKRLKFPKHATSLAIENRLRLLEPLDISFKNIHPKIYLTASEKQKAKKFLIASGIELGKSLYMISVLGSSPEKTYPADYMAKVLDEVVLTKPESQLLFNYIPKQEKEAKEIYDSCQPITQKRIFFEVFGKSLRDFITITSHCNAMIGNEGGAVNMAKAIDIPTFIIFSPHLNKANWFGETESNTNVAVHLSDYVNHNKEDRTKAKSNPEMYYRKFKPSYLTKQLHTFLANV